MPRSKKGRKTDSDQEKNDYFGGEGETGESESEENQEGESNDYYELPSNLSEGIHREYNVAAKADEQESDKGSDVPESQQSSQQQAVTVEKAEEGGKGEYDEQQQETYDDPINNQDPSHQDPTSKHSAYEDPSALSGVGTEQENEDDRFSTVPGEGDEHEADRDLSVVSGEGGENEEGLPIAISGEGAEHEDFPTILSGEGVEHEAEDRPSAMPRGAEERPSAVSSEDAEYEGGETLPLSRKGSEHETLEHHDYLEDPDFGGGEKDDSKNDGGDEHEGDYDDYGPGDPKNGNEEGEANEEEVKQAQMVEVSTQDNKMEGDDEENQKAESEIQDVSSVRTGRGEKEGEESGEMFKKDEDEDEEGDEGSADKKAEGDKEDDVDVAGGESSAVDGEKGQQKEDAEENEYVEVNELEVGSVEGQDKTYEHTKAKDRLSQSTEVSFEILHSNEGEGFDELGEDRGPEEGDIKLHTEDQHLGHSVSNSQFSSHKNREGLEAPHDGDDQGLSNGDEEKAAEENMDGGAEGGRRVEGADEKQHPAEECKGAEGADGKQPAEESRQELQVDRSGQDQSHGSEGQSALEHSGRRYNRREIHTRYVDEYREGAMLDDEPQQHKQGQQPRPSLKPRHDQIQHNQQHQQGQQDQRPAKGNEDEQKELQQREGIKDDDRGGGASGGGAKRRADCARGNADGGEVEEYYPRNSILSADAEPDEVAKSLAAGKNPKELDIPLDQIRKEHKTDKYAGSDLIFRRGFKITFNYDVSEVAVYKAPNKYATTPAEEWPARAHRKVSLDSSNPKVGGWELENNALKIPANCIIGLWKLYVNGDGPYNIKVIFNPYCEKDTVFMEDENGRQEYVENEYGRIYNVDKSYIDWNYAQFERKMLDICLKLLNISKIDTRDKSSPIKVSRALSDVINIESGHRPGQGLLVGRWDNKFDDGISPVCWRSSRDIFYKWYTDKSAVKYGQCFIFAACFCTALRCLGIPNRTVACTGSFNDFNENMLADAYIDSQGRLNFINDSLWTFHVWNEAWFRRIDLPKGFDGWQAVDSTPVDKSGGHYQCGPSSVKAIKSARVDLPYDSKFVFAEVNADVAVWKGEDGNQRNQLKRVLNNKTIAKSLFTKEVLKHAPVNVMSNYKDVPGSQEERSRARKAADEGTTPWIYHSVSYSSLNLNMIEEHVLIQSHVPTVINVGEPIKYKFEIDSGDEDSRMSLNCVIKTYHGLVLQDIFTVKEEKGPLEGQIEYDQYSGFVSLTNLVEFRVVVDSKAVSTVDTFPVTFTSGKPKIEVISDGPHKVGQPIGLKFAYTNEYPFTLNNWKFCFIAPSLRKQYVNIKKPFDPGASDYAKIEWLPRRKGKFTLILHVVADEAESLEDGIIDIEIE